MVEQQNFIQTSDTRAVFLYIRVSTLDQIGGAESQTRALTEWCEKNGIKNFETFTDHGISGAKESRPALNRMMEKVEAGLCSQVVVFQFSRFARSTTHLLKALEKFRERKVRFHSLCESIDTDSPMGLALFTILGCSSWLLCGDPHNSHYAKLGIMRSKLHCRRHHAVNTRLSENIHSA